jgi:hypothetical protein
MLDDPFSASDGVSQSGSSNESDAVPASDEDFETFESAVTILRRAFRPARLRPIAGIVVVEIHVVHARAALADVQTTV